MLLTQLNQVLYFAFLSALLSIGVSCAPSIEDKPGGCYLINDGHKCDCALSTDECGAVFGIWTERCECEEETPCDSSDPFTHVEHDDGSSTTTVNASCEENWVYLNLSEKAEATPDTPDDSEEWDLGFQRFKIKSNGGISGSRNVVVAMTSEATFDELEEAPAMGYLSDAEDSEDEGEDPDFAFLAPEPWYDYDQETHILTPKDQVYIVQSVSGDYFKLQILDYYDDAGTSGYLKFKWATIMAPAE
ncbi:MAG: hypothetical protein CMH56_07960 [Myxococcales bacterium]|nr:hypothetical protein [Myxococcales bacterium]|tara:strand:+ start:2906 stop:3643 length:738 start_codon:yes stop_codon:yes gene_type:complete